MSTSATEVPKSTRGSEGVMTQALKTFRQAPLPSQFGFIVVSTYIFIALFAPVLSPFE